MTRLRLFYIVVMAFALGIFLCRNVNEKYVNNKVKKILIDIKTKEREGR